MNMNILCSFTQLGRDELNEPDPKYKCNSVVKHIENSRKTRPTEQLHIRQERKKKKLKNFLKRGLLLI